ncbi:MAG: DUF6449 domain-containing protein [Candidatus Limivivens sp.]|nr:DUF6449 domain-containing protein [Candidatus Limivivens sp.]
MKRRSWLVAVSLLVLFLALSVRLLLDIDTQVNLLPDQVTALSEMRTKYLEIVSFGNYLLILPVLGGLALVSGISGFSYIHFREKLDFFHSLPVKRKRWFRVQYLAGVLITAVPYLLCVMLCALIGNVFGLARAGDMGRILEAYVVHMLYYLVIYSIAVLASILTGKLIVSVLAFGVLMCLGPVYMLLMVELASAFFSTYCGQSGWGELWWNFLSPSGLCVDIEYKMQLYQTGAGFPGLPILLLFLLIILLIGVDMVVFQKRRTEMAGNSVAFPCLEKPLKFLLTVPAAMGTGLFMADLAKQNSDIWFFGGIIFCAVLFSGLVEFIYHTDIREVFKPKLQLGIILAVSLLIGSAFRFDWLGYDEYLPEMDEIEGMAVYQSSLHCRGNYEDGEITWDERVRDTLKRSTLTDFEPIYELAENGVENAVNQKNRGTRISVRYQLKNGKEVFRNYRVDSEIYEACQQRLFENPDYLKNLYAIYRAPEEGYYALEVSNLYGYSGTIRLSRSQREKLMDAYKEELMHVTYEQMTGDDLIAQLAFYYGDDDNYSIDGEYPVLKSFTKTIDMLEELGVTIPERIQVEDVVSVEVYGIARAVSYSDSDGNGVIMEETSSGNKLFTDPKDIQEIVECLNLSDSTMLRYSSYADGLEDGYYSIYLSYADSQQFVSFYLGCDEAPECIQEAFCS